MKQISISDILTLTKEAIVSICDSTSRSEILGLIPLVVVTTTKLHSAAPRVISLPFLLQLVKFIPNFTHARAITYKNYCLPNNLLFFNNKTSTVIPIAISLFSI